MLSPFTIHRADTVAQASAMLTRYGPDAAIYAGGTELLVLMKERLAHFSHLIDIKPVPGLAGITLDDAGGSISIGPLASHRSIETSPLIRQHAPLLAELESQVANVRVRHAGTIGGNLCFAEPHSDPATLLVAWDATFTLDSAEQSRTVQAGDFFVGLLETARADDELLTGITLPVLPGNAGSAYQRFKTHERPTAAVAAVLWMSNGEITGSRVVAGSVGNRPQRLGTVEHLLKNNQPSPDLYQQAGETAATEVAIEEEGFESSDYKRHLIGVLTAKALHQAAERAA
jgi:aerobic carbon-monoxide dehydrogenase medium subunit